MRSLASQSRRRVGSHASNKSERPARLAPARSGGVEVACANRRRHFFGLTPEPRRDAKLALRLMNAQVNPSGLRPRRAAVDAKSCRAEIGCADRLGTGCRDGQGAARLSGLSESVAQQP
jgi:hypothetical protein